MTSKPPSPRDLDPKFKDADVPEDDSKTPVDPDETYIVHKQPSFDKDGNPTTIVHGPMPVSEWADYAKEHRL